MRERIPVEPLQEAFARSGLTLGDVAYRAGWTKRIGRSQIGPDTSRVARRLGLVPTTSGVGSYERRSLTVEVAVVLVRAMGLDPVDFKEWGL